MNRPISHRQQVGFTIVELLSVIAIVVLLTVMVIPAFNSIRGSRNLSKSGYDIVAILEQARAHAMAQNTYVWVGLQKVGNDGLVVGVVASRSGASNPGTDFVPVGKIHRFESIQLLKDPDIADPDSVQLAEVSPPILKFQVSKDSNPNSQPLYVIQWNGRGEARVSTTKIPKLIGFRLLASADGTVRNAVDYVALRISGLSGAVTLRQP